MTATAPTQRLAFDRTAPGTYTATVTGTTRSFVIVRLTSRSWSVEMRLNTRPVARAEERSMLRAFMLAEKMEAVEVLDYRGAQTWKDLLD